MKKILRFKSEIAAGFATLATLMIFLPALALRNTSQAYTGLEVGFGVEIDTLGLLSQGELRFNLMIVLAYLLPLVAGLSLLFMRHGEKIASFIFLVAIILLVSIPETANLYILTDGIDVAFPVAWEFSYGLTMAIMFTLIGFSISLYQTLHKLKEQRISKKKLNESIR